MPSLDLTPVLHVVAAFSEREGGPARYISELCSDLAARGRSVSLLTAAQPGDHLMAVGESVRVQALPRNGRISAGVFARAVAAWAADHPAGLVHLHGLWVAPMHEAATAARQAGRPVVWAPMGMLEPWALRHRAWKKRIAWWLFQRRDLAGAGVLHATSRLEADGVRQVGLRSPVAVIPLGVALPPRREPVAAATRTALFLSRIHPKKGIAMLLAAWAALRPTGWRLVIAGNDENGHAAEIAAMIVRLRLSHCVTILGPVYGEAKEVCFGTADLFVLPSHSENFAVVIAEALVRGLPVLTTTGTPWREIAEQRAGWWVQPTPVEIQRALAEATACSRESLRSRGENGARWAREQFAWGGIVTRMEALYAWLDSRAACPAWVEAMP